MVGYNFTERARKVLAMARQEAIRLRHQYVGTEHILLGLLREGEGVAWTLLEEREIDVDAVRTAIERAATPGTVALAAGLELPYTSRAKRVLELAMSEARNLGHSHVGTEHLLLGLLREENGIAAQVLVDAGASLDAARADLLRIFPPDGSDEPLPAGSRMRTHATRGFSGEAVPGSVTIEIAREDGSVVRRELRTIADAIRYLNSYPEER